MSQYQDFLGVQCLRLHTSTAGGAGSIPDWELRSICQLAQPEEKCLYLHRDIDNRIVVVKGEGGWGRGGLGVWNLQMQTSVYRIDKQSTYSTQNYIQYCDKL